MYLQNLFQKETCQERYETSKSLFITKMAEGTSVSAHVLELSGYHEKLARVGFAIWDELTIDVILQSFPSSYSQFVKNRNMNNIQVSLSELHGMLKTTEQTIKGKTEMY